MIDDEPPGLGIHILAGETLLHMLRRVGAGEAANDVYAELYANAEHIRTEGDEDE